MYPWDDEENTSLVERIAERISKLLEHFALSHPLGPQLLYNKEQAANQLGVSTGSLQILIDRGDVRVRRWGSRVLIPREELERVAKKEFAELWPEKGPDGKTRRRIVYERHEADAADTKTRS